MRIVFLILVFLSTPLSSQEAIDVSLLQKQNINTEFIVGIDPFGTQFLLSNDVLSKVKDSRKLTYNNFSLGEITSVNTFNSLKPNVFYSDFNTVVILDNRLAEVAQLNFNLLSPNRNVTQVSTGHDSTIWLFNKASQQLELFDYKTNKSRMVTLPIEGDVLDMISDYNSCWVLTDDFVYHYNYFGSLISKFENSGFTQIKSNKNNLILFKDNKLYFHENDFNNLIPIKLPELLIKQFFVTNETLYIYDGKTLYHYQLIND